MSDIYVGGVLGSDQIQTLTTNGTVTGYGYTVKCNSASLSSTLVITCPTATAKTGQKFTICKTDNSNNAIQIVPYGGQTINGSSSIYLYGKDDSVVLISDGTNLFIGSDNRSSTGSSASFLRATTTTPLTTLSGGTIVPMNINETSVGNKIINNANGTFTLLSGSSYKIHVNLVAITATLTTAFMDYFIEKSIDGGTTWSVINITGEISSPTATRTYGISQDLSVSIPATTANTIIRVKLGANSNVTAIGESSTGFPYIEVEEISRQATVIQTVDTLHAVKTSGQGFTGAGDVTFTQQSGNITFDGTYANLIAGKTYEISAGIIAQCTSTTDFAFLSFTDSSNNVLAHSSIKSTGVGYSGATNITSMQNGSIIITPISNIQVKLRVISVNSGTHTINADSYFIIKQLGSSACTSIPLNLISGITDSASSGYFDIGTMRIQFGTVAGGINSVTLPMPFANTNYIITTTMIIGCMGTATPTTKSTTAFNVVRTFYNGTTYSTPGEGFSWIAIGQH